MLKFDLGFEVDVGYAVPPVAVIVLDDDHHKSGFSVNLSVLCFLVAGAFFLFVSLWLLCCYRAKIEQARLRLYGIIERREAGETVINVEQVRPVDDDDLVDHPIWYIRTQGLQQSVIDSISVVKYKKDEGLVEGTDCSVCLSEFEEDESLRLLPKCAHAFHVPCIDQWFRSHKNCPLCRSPVMMAGRPMFNAEEVREAVTVRQQQLEQESNENGIGLLEGQNANTSEEDLDSDSSYVSENVSSGLVVNNDSAFCANGITKPERESGSQRASESELQCMRRWVSAGPVAASNMYGAVNEVKIQVDSGSSHMQGTKNSGCGRNSPEPEQARTRGSIMKRSASYGGKPSSTKSGRRQSPTLPY